MFRFRFEQVLNVRKLAEERILQEFSEHVRSLESEKEQLRSIRGEKAAVLADLMRRRDGTLSAGEIGITFGYLRGLRQREVAQAVLVADREKALEVKREELTEAVKRRKIMEILKEKKFAQYWKEWNHKESMALNEQGIIRFLKRSGDEKT
ncbi:MAG TPA: flagellar export protein FliJ, partial [Syntrophales bacterium]|nr:flagellar export protein FliJ [Syntrophales bacterium]